MLDVLCAEVLLVVCEGKVNFAHLQRVLDLLPEHFIWEAGQHFEF